jgi:spore photoproduct lyase
MSTEFIKRKSLIIRESGRSTDYISPSFAFGCGFDCSYCYMKRHKPDGIDIATNTEEILTEIDHHAWFSTVDKPNQTHEEFVTYDIGCNFDLPLHAKHIDWEKIFTFFRDHPRAMGSFATKYVNYDLLEFNPKGKVRIRFSMMPPKMRKILEPNTSLIGDRLYAIQEFIDAGYDVHINFSPVIVYGDKKYGDNWIEGYRYLFREISQVIDKKNWDKVKCEVIFLTHNENKHVYNLMENIPGEDLLWRPDIQEDKISEFGGKNIRYKHGLKAEYIRQWTELHDEIIPWNTIRYIF